MRIIAGDMGSRRLKTPAGTDTRPTADRVKEALFSILGARVYGARVLDLYAGSGALALEALSRGAAEAVLCDKSRDACRVIRENIESLGCQSRARLLPMQDTLALNALQTEGQAFSLVFLDPPYRMDTAPICALLAEYGLVGAGGLVVVEHSRETPPEIALPLKLTDRREYGVTGLSFYHLEEEA